MAHNDGRAVGTWGTAGGLVEKTQISLKFLSLAIVFGKIFMTEYEQSPLASEPET